MAGTVAALYLALAQYVVRLNEPVSAGAGFWPAAGLTLAALLLLPTRRWAWVVGAIVVAEMGVGRLNGYPIVASTWWAAGNALEPLLAAVLLRRFSPGGRLSPLRNLLHLLAAGVVLGPMVGAAIGSVGTSTAYDTAWLRVFPQWWVGDGLGVLVVAPLLLCFREPRVPDRTRLEAGALAVMLVVVPLVAYKRWSSEWDLVLPYLLIPMILWASIRFGIRGAAIAGIVLTLVTNGATVLELGPFFEPESGGLSLTVLQIFLCLPLIVGLVVATVVTDGLNRTRSYERQRSVAEALQLAVLPERLPEVRDLELAARYAPALEDATIHVGGDWYDAFELPSGAIALAVGDVGGHDLPAAVAMAQLRNGLRSLFMESEDPAGALTSLDRSWPCRSTDCSPRPSAHASAPGRCRGRTPATHPCCSPGPTGPSASSRATRTRCSASVTWSTTPTPSPSKSTTCSSASPTASSSIAAGHSTTPWGTSCIS